MHRLGYWILIFLLKMFSVLPLGFHYRISGCLAFLLHKVIRYRYSTVITNISRSFPELTYRQVTDIARDFYGYLADIIVESVWCYSASREKIGKQIEITGQDDLHKALSNGKSAVIMLGHIGNWEIFTGLPDLRENYGLDIDNKDFIYIYKKPAGEIADMVINNIRKRHDSCFVIDTHSIFRHIVAHRNDRQVVFFICDQNPERSESRFTVDFLNQKTYMIDGPEQIAAKLGLPVLYCGLVRKGRRDNSANFRLITENAAECEPGYVTAEFARRLEHDIREHKAFWLWSHKRWKKRIL